MDMDRSYNNIENRITYLCSRVTALFFCNCVFALNTGEIIFHNAVERLRYPVNENKIKDHFYLNMDNMKDTAIFVKQVELFRHYIHIRVVEESLNGFFIIGPFLTLPINEKDLQKLLYESNIEVKYYNKLLNYSKNITILPYNSLCIIGELMYLYLTDSQAKVSIEDDRHFNEAISCRKEHNHIQEITKLYNTLHSSQDFEYDILHYIKKGNSKELERYLAEEFRVEGIRDTSLDTIRKHKNAFIAAMSTASLMAVEGGVDWEESLLMRDQFEEEIEKTKSIEEIQRYYFIMYMAFVRKVELYATENLNRIIIKAKNYIKNQVYEKISLQDVARKSGLNGNYFASLFKKETGYTVGEYIIQCKIDEAKYLLRKKYTILDISEILKFTDSSHFTKQFKKVTDITPKQYCKSL